MERHDASDGFALKEGRKIIGSRGVTHHLEREPWLASRVCEVIEMLCRCPQGAAAAPCGGYACTAVAVLCGLVGVLRELRVHGR